MHDLITGGAGFIGSHVAEALLRQGHRVTVVDDLSTGSEDNVAHLESNPGFACVVESIENVGVLDALVAEADRVFHLAAAVGVRLVVDSPVRTIECNVHGTECVLRAAAKRGAPVLIASSSEVYGKSDAVPFREDSDLLLGPTTRGRWAYACSKAIDEFLAFGYAKQHGLPVVIARLFNTVGPRQTGRYGMVMPTLARQALAGDAMTVFGDGTQRRTFVHVADAVAALVGLMDCEQAVGGIFNVGGDRSCTILELAERIQKLAGSSSPICFIPYDQAYEQGFEDIATRVPDTTRIRTLLGWKPLHDLDDAIRDLLSYLGQG